MNYIAKSNTKAVAHFKNLGYKLTPSVRYYGKYLTDSGYDYLLSWDVYIVDVPWSGKKFHRYLKDNGLLLSQQK